MSAALVISPGQTRSKRPASVPAPVAGGSSRRPPRAQRRCARCGCVLAADNLSSLCSPCARSERERESNAGLRLDPAAVRAAFARGGAAAVVAELGCRPEEAIVGAVAAGVLSPLYLRRIGVLAQLMELHELSHVAAAERTGLSRWTVATYRRDLGLDGARTS
jgi:hypothetical protein